MLQVTDLECVRSDRSLFHHLNFSLANGELLHVQGENGSGKTSLIRMLSGLLSPVDGNILWNGAPIRALGETYRNAVAYLGHLNALKDDLNAIENLSYALTISATPTSKHDVCAALKRFGVIDHARLPLKVLSQGQKRRVALARFLLTKAKLWLLDEPFAALDASACDQLRAVIAAHLAAGGIVVISSHQELNIPSAALKRVNLGTP
jgi:heme exporter protein A